jgi:hypothetical protein
VDTGIEPPESGRNCCPTKNSTDERGAFAWRLVRLLLIRQGPSLQVILHDTKERHQKYFSLRLSEQHKIVSIVSVMPEREQEQTRRMNFAKYTIRVKITLTKYQDNL